MVSNPAEISKPLEQALELFLRDVWVKLGAKLEPKYRAVDNSGRQFRCSILVGFRAKCFHQHVVKPTRGQCSLHHLPRRMFGLFESNHRRATLAELPVA
jgi:hypothetical protein